MVTNNNRNIKQCYIVEEIACPLKAQSISFFRSFLLISWWLYIKNIIRFRLLFLPWRVLWAVPGCKCCRAPRREPSPKACLSDRQADTWPPSRILLYRLFWRQLPTRDVSRSPAALSRRRWQSPKWSRWWPPGRLSGRPLKSSAMNSRGHCRTRLSREGNCQSCELALLRGHNVFRLLSLKLERKNVSEFYWLLYTVPTSLNKNVRI